MNDERPTVYYNENDRKAAAWLRELISAGLIANGIVDERSIAEVQPADLAGFVQCHFFAGIGGWSYALRLAGWPDSRPVWTASCPCQPFSVGATDEAKGTGDERDLWPVFFPLMRLNKPPTVFGEQVKNAISWGWWDRSKMDCENEGYSTAAAVLRADAIGAVHQRKRLYWVANAGSARREGCQQDNGVFIREKSPHAINGDAITQSRRAVGGSWADLLRGDGFPVQLVRCALKGFGNAIVPQVAAEFIKASEEAIQEITLLNEHTAES